MYTGDQPWGKITTMLDALNKIGKSEDIPEIPDDISSEFRNFLLLCFKRNPKERADVETLMLSSFVL
jgi:serine/threonine protein kinase